ncbi:response regulator transcription factor [Cronobacter dublinensis]
MHYTKAIIAMKDKIISKSNHKSVTKVYVVTENYYFYYGVKCLIESHVHLRDNLKLAEKSSKMPDLMFLTSATEKKILITDNYLHCYIISQCCLKNTLVLPSNYNAPTYLECFGEFYDKKSEHYEKVLKRLSPRETMLLALFSSGITDDTISTKLQIHKKTVSTHRQNILSKLNLKNRHELYLLAFASKGDSL